MNLDEEITKEITIDDQTPTIIEQAKLNGWDADYYNFGKLEGQGTDFFNPSIVEREDGLWLLTRASGLHPHGFMYGQNAIVAFMLDESGKVPKMGKILRWPVNNPLQHFEDPRGFYHPELNQTFIGCCTFLWNGPGDWTGPHQVFGAFDENWECKKMDYPLVGGNPGTMEKITEHRNYEKNWLWWQFDGKLHLLYKAAPWLVIEFNQRWSERKEYKGKAVGWSNGEIRGGTTPVRVGDLYFTFHHSSLPWKGRYRRYYAGCLAFDANPPFTPRMITSVPLLQGSQNDPWAQRKPLVIFPCGALYRNSKWLITCGVNDLCSAWIEIPHEKLLERMNPIDVDASFVFSKPILSGVEPTRSVEAVEAERCQDQAEPCNSALPSTPNKKRKPFSPERLEAMRANLARARAIRAEKRATGNNDEPPLPKRRRRRKRFKRVTAETRQKALAEFEASKTLSS